MMQNIFLLALNNFKTILTINVIKVVVCQFKIDNFLGSSLITLGSYFTPIFESFKIRIVNGENKQKSHEEESIRYYF
jgi:hypothetical protein